MPYIAQLFFLSELEDLDATRRCMLAIRETRAAQLGAYKRIEKERRAAFGGSLDDATDEQFHQHITLEAGIRVGKARLKWCDDTLEQIDRRIARNKRKNTSKRKQPQ